MGLSYALGQAVAGIFCRTVLLVTHLMHVDRYANQYRLLYGGTRKRADLFGLAPSGWGAAEAKGRSRSMDASLKNKLVGQKQSIAAIQGSPPWLGLGCVASFPIPNDGLQVDAFDPKGDSEESITLDITLDRYMLAYYLPFLNTVDLVERRQNSDQLVSISLATGRRPGCRRMTAVLTVTSSTMPHSDTTQRTPDAHAA